MNASDGHNTFVQALNQLSAEPMRAQGKAESMRFALGTVGNDDQLAAEISKLESSRAEVAF